MAKPVFDSVDYEKNHLTGTLGYLIFFIPLIACPNSRFGRFCANQGILLWVLMAVLAVVSALLGWIPLIGWLIHLVCNLLRLVVFALMLYYGWKAYSGQAEPLPYIGGIELLR